MKVFHRYQNIPASALNGITVIGNFDGVHKGHQEILNYARELAKKEGKPFNVLTFEPHPRQVFNPKTEAFRITPIRSKVRIMRDMGVDNLMIMHFSKALFSMSAEKFTSEVLAKGLAVSHVVVGDNYRFGKERGGDVNTLIKLGKHCGFQVTSLPILNNREGERFSSSLIRLYLRRGDLESAENILGRHWEIEGRVIKGKQLGRTLGFPTANIRLNKYLKPRTGVYAVKVGIPVNQDEYEWHNAVANFGTRPTVNGKGLLFESHIFNWEEDIYGKRIIIRLIEYLRPEMKIQDIEKLKQTINEDKAWAQIILS